ncbi:phage tail sheath C-terminal domain-containing protein [Variovorax humicola]|uniref:Phage tail sheath C-terminal domain-containing protein n=1 Tax=Variovorax humicola TaxID=1769758 RepID=A0ABU8VWX1_9BURK
MPSALLSPGVYIEEVASGVRTITGVATSITAFVGRTSQGIVSEPALITSFGDFERLFGGVQFDYPLSYAVQDFYLNGGSQAIIVRLESGAVAASAQLPTGGANNEALRLLARSPGTWANSLTVTSDNATGTPSDTSLFNLTIVQAGGATEKFLNVSSSASSARFVARVLDSGSLLATLPKDASGNWVAPAARPTAGSAAFSGGVDSANLADSDYVGSAALKTGLHALEKASLFNLLCIPPDERGGDTSSPVYQAAMAYCATRRAVLLVDPPVAWGLIKETAAAAASDATTGVASLGLTGEAARNAALFFPRVIKSDAQLNGQLDVFAPCGVVAGIIARTDSTRGVWKAPAGLDAALNGVQGLQVNLTDGDNGVLNPLGINCLRAFPVTGRVVWGARTMRGADLMADEYKYLPVRRLALFIEESLYQGMQWAVFEPNDEPLWSQLRLNIGAFMQGLFRQGAFQGSTPAAAYFVKCDSETTTQNDINLGVVNVLVGFAPLKPAEFVVLRLQQMAGQIAA